MSTRHIVYMGLSDLVPAVRNAKDHDLPSIVASLRRYGWASPAELDERTGRLVAGHGRREACILIRQNGEPPPGGVFIDDDGEWLVPVLRGWASRNDTEAEAYIIASNRLVEAGGWVERTLAEMLEDVVTEDAPLIETLGFTADDLDQLLARNNPEWLDSHEQTDRPEPAEPLDPDQDDTDDDEAVIPGTRRECPVCRYEWVD